MPCNRKKQTVASLLLAVLGPILATGASLCPVNLCTLPSVPKVGIVHTQFYTTFKVNDLFVVALVISLCVRLPRTVLCRPPSS